MNNLQTTITAAFETKFGSKPELVIRAPGRVNLIGEHTDYNDGFVLPMAIDRAVWLALRPRPDRQVVVHSLNFEQPTVFDLDDVGHEPDRWGEYVRGMAWVLQEAGHTLCGWEGILTSDVPVGAGLSSSAALELAIGRTFAALGEIPWRPAEMALLSQKAENQWVGVNSGIMDQMISASGKADHALLIDCRDLSTQLVALPAGTAVIILDTATRRGLVDSAYNERRSQCEAAAEFFGVAHLRDVSLADFIQREHELDDLTRRRARHVISENERVLAAVTAMNAGDATETGRLMEASHTSLRDDFEVSSEAMNVMVNLALAEPGCFGARMTGAGFGGCAVALVAADQATTFANSVAQKYKTQTGRKANVYICRATDGAEIIDERRETRDRRG